ncbi:hypothetical protein [Mycobacterium pseudokansasii]|uniref:Uncharacterized protein n=1 Tax=Mycobacterium pseudokansasii TaxID=2341080 RepID=A0A498QYW4_9MYCO|nr:hypothetical protein [Mycobacterium pseudokansasii]VBA53488.1 hypothetical protein LAUMK142_04087 [Mycobacterium pseudokansasii]
MYDALVYFARQWVSRTGRHRLGVANLYERARWELAITTDDRDDKLSNNHRAFYARLIMAQEPDLDGLLVLRPSEADEWIEKRNMDTHIIALCKENTYRWELKRVSKTEILLSNKRCAIRFPFTYEGTLKVKEAAGGQRIKIEPLLKQWIRAETVRLHQGESA